MTRIYAQSTTLIFMIISLAYVSTGCSSNEANSQDNNSADLFGQETYRIYEGHLSPLQEGSEEEDQPANADPALRGQPPYTPRAERTSRGYGKLSFAKNGSKGRLEFAMTGLEPSEIVMFHIHCGPPGALGPVIMNLASLPQYDEETLFTNLFDEDLTFNVEFTNDNITTAGDPTGPFPSSLPEGCANSADTPSPGGEELSQVTTVGGMEYLARQGILYFNVHTFTHTYYGEMRGQIYPAND